MFRWLDRVQSWLTVLRGAFDTGPVLVGSLLPDMIGKPLGHAVLREMLSNGWTFCHAQRRYSGALLWALALGTGAHLGPDLMWRTPRTLLRPAYGWSFSKNDLTGWARGLRQELTTNLAVHGTCWVVEDSCPSKAR